MKKDQQKYTTYALHGVLLLAIAGSAWWAYTGFAEKDVEEEDSAFRSQATVDHSLHDMGLDTGDAPRAGDPATEGTPMSSANGGSVTSRDEAARGFLNAAQEIAEVYRFTNGSYAGLCENSEDHLTLEGESGGILKYVKFVGATEVYCYTGGTDYMIEVKLPESGMFYCIDQTGTAVEQEETKEGIHTCA